MASNSARRSVIKVNAGHGLHYTNVQPIAAIEGIVELNIGHAIVAHAIFAGWDNAVREMKAIMVAARLAPRVTPTDDAHGDLRNRHGYRSGEPRGGGHGRARTGASPKRCSAPDELRIYHARHARSAVRGLAFLATRFSAKEAFSKAIGLGMRWPMTWRALQTLNKPSGKPMVVASGELADMARRARHHGAGHDQRRTRLRGVVRDRGNGRDPDPSGFQPHSKNKPPAFSFSV